MGFDLVVLDIRRQKVYRVKTDLDQAYERCKDLMLIEDKVYFDRYDCYDENFGAKVIECDPATGAPRALKI